jgi:hypothetical protein
LTKLCTILLSTGRIELLALFLMTHYVNYPRMISLLVSKCCNADHNKDSFNWVNICVSYRYFVQKYVLLSILHVFIVNHSTLIAIRFQISVPQILLILSSCSHRSKNKPICLKLCLLFGFIKI